MTPPPIRLPSGVRDFLPRAAARRRALAGRVLEVFEAWGYARIVTPVFEVADVLERGLGQDAPGIQHQEPAIRPVQRARLEQGEVGDPPGPRRLPDRA